MGADSFFHFHTTNGDVRYQNAATFVFFRVPLRCQPTVKPNNLAIHDLLRYCETKNNR